ncbi:4a-hydroxytetrahydrobiopterin dehydratase [Leptothoe kymatousa]|uniref:4a-hydroxytetrahydrobiopterin dehydratase n=1 Tax=Leptothoe kymatousa TAU-MAC 1615 TaxID=2364775 RepID=A0ABS5XZQ3_9CYAN|nr:4a-hydroxytetrahydrobiopterin dehydratase [Leptothoe kymatousa]MBT9311082.1 4a-hydroxytetrahydrobiopterin dehydratase [Leptothoe kymatousa TAU-MAC 1615]
MSEQIFISYRRADSTSEAGRLYSSITKELQGGTVFMDTAAIDVGTEWAQELEDALTAAQIVLVVIGPDWLRISDEWGMRRIDQPQDWVRREIERALTTDKKLLPVLVKGAKLPPVDKLPESIRDLVQWQAVDIRDAYWDHDIQLVLQQLRMEVETTQADRGEMGDSQVYPTPPPEKPDPLSEEKISIALGASLASWKIVSSPLPQDLTKVRTELCRSYRFKSFSDAIGFMHQVAPGCDIAMHHPRWENLWRTLNVYLTTWDIGHAISDRDIQLAKYLDHAYGEFPGAAID